MTRGRTYPYRTWTDGTYGSFEGTAFAPMGQAGCAPYHQGDGRHVLTSGDPESGYPALAPVVVRDPRQRPTLNPVNLEPPEETIHRTPVPKPVVSLVIKGKPIPNSVIEPEPDPWHGNKVIVFSADPDPYGTHEREEYAYTIDLEAIRRAIAQTIHQNPRLKVGPPPVLWVQVPVYPVTHGR